MSESAVQIHSPYRNARQHWINLPLQNAIKRVNVNVKCKHQLIVYYFDSLKGLYYGGKYVVQNYLFISSSCLHLWHGLAGYTRAARYAIMLGRSVKNQMIGHMDSVGQTRSRNARAVTSREALPGCFRSMKPMKPWPWPYHSFICRLLCDILWSCKDVLWSFTLWLWCSKRDVP